MAEVKIMDGGVAEYMGDGIYVLLQKSEDGPQSVAITVDDLRSLLSQLEP